MGLNDHSELQTTAIFQIHFGLYCCITKNGAHENSARVPSGAPLPYGHNESYLDGVKHEACGKSCIPYMAGPTAPGINWAAQIQPPVLIPPQIPERGGSD